MFVINQKSCYGYCPCSNPREKKFRISKTKIEFDCILELDGNAIFLDKQTPVFEDGCPNLSCDPGPGPGPGPGRDGVLH